MANSADPATPDLIDLVREAREALGLFHGAMPASPKAAWEDALDCMRAMDVRHQQGSAEASRLRSIIKVLCSHKSPRGSEAFQYARDTLNPDLRALLIEVLDG